MTQRRLELRCYLVLAFVAFSAAVDAQQTGAGGSAVNARVAASLSWTDNLNLSSSEKDAAFITTVSPGISIFSNGGAVRGSLDYSLNGIAYIKSNQASQIQNALSASGQAEVIPRRFYINAQASIGQQNQSAFGLQAAPTMNSQGAVSTLSNANSHETGTLSVSPLLTGQLGGIASFDLRGNFAVTEVRGTSLGDSRNSGGSLRISQLVPGALSWYSTINTQTYRSKGLDANSSSSMVAGLSYRPDPDWAFTANVGQERNNYVSGGSDSQGGFTGGVTASWTPTPRTNVNGDWQRHAYGNSHSLSLQHRLTHAVLSMSDSRNLTLGNTGSTGGVRTVYDLYFSMYASLEPDPAKRDAFVRALLLALGLSPDAPLSNGFASSGPSELRNQTFSFALQGVRTSLTAALSRAVTNRLGDNLNQGDLADHARIEQRSYSLSGNYQLSPVSALSVSVAMQQTMGDATTAGTRLKTLSLNWTGRLGARISLQLGARHSRFDGSTAYAENAAYANLNQQF